MKRTSSKLAMLAAGLVIAGCSVTKMAYQPPTSGPVAHVTLRNSMDVAATYALYQDSAHCSRRRISPAISPGRGVTLDFAANTELALTANYVSVETKKTCRVTVSFPVESGRSYLVDMEPRPNGCAVLATVLDAAGQPMAPVQGRMRTARMGFDEESDWCQP